MYTNYPFGVCLAHNGNLTNVKELRESVFAEARHINTDSVRGTGPWCFSVLWSFLRQGGAPRRTVVPYIILHVHVYNTALTRIFGSEQLCSVVVAVASREPLPR